MLKAVESPAMNILRRSTPSPYSGKAFATIIALHCLIAAGLSCVVAGLAGAAERELELRFLPQEEEAAGYLVYLTLMAVFFVGW